MRAKTILTVLFVISLVVAGIVFVRAMPQMAPAGAPEAAKDEILVATAPLPAGTLLRPQDVAWERATGATEPGQIVRPDAVTRETKPELDEEARAKVYGAALRGPVAAGDPIRRSGIVKPGDREYLELVLSPGTRAIVVPVHYKGPSGPGAQLLGPFSGDRVDAILTQKFTDVLPMTRRSVGEAIAENLRVLHIAPPTAKGNGADVDTTIPMTLEVTPEQAEKISVALELGKLSFTLRGVAGAGAMVASLTPGPGNPNGIKPVWAGDVSPALGGAMPQKEVTVERPAIDVIHGSKTERVNAPWHPDVRRADRDGNNASDARSQ